MFGWFAVVRVWDVMRSLSLPAGRSLDYPDGALLDDAMVVKPQRNPSPEDDAIVPRPDAESPDSVTGKSPARHDHGRQRP
jgi:hypothetical protein